MSHLSQKLTDRTELAEAPASGDFLHVVDVSDTTDSAEGTSKKVQAQYLTIADASTTVKGKVELATDAETITGTDTVRAITPSNLTGKMDTDGTLAGNLDTRIPSQKAVKTYVDANAGSDIAPQNLLKNGNFINNSTNGYGSTPDDWTSSNANPVQGGIPALTKQNFIDITGVTTAQIEGLWNLNGDFTDLSDNGYNLTASGSPTDSSDGLMAQAKDFEDGSTQYATNTSPTNIRSVTGSQTWGIWVKPETVTSVGVWRMFGRMNASATFHQVDLLINTGKFMFEAAGLTTNTSVYSDAAPVAGKWYFICGVYDSANTKLKIWVNGIKKEVTASGSITTAGTEAVSIGRSGAYAADYFDGLAQNGFMLSTALSDNQVKKLFAETMYKGQKIRRATTNAYAYQQLPQDLVERLRGKTVALRADIYQAVASTAQISIYQTMADATTDETIISATDATTGSWLSKVATGTLESDVVTIEIRIKHSTTDGNTWFRNVSLYEGSTLLPYDHSKDDWSRFPRLLKMDIPAIISGYQFEENRYFSYTPTGIAATNVTLTGRFQFSGKQCSSCRIKVAFTGGITFTTMPSLPIVAAAGIIGETNNPISGVGHYLDSGTVNFPYGVAPCVQPSATTVRVGRSADFADITATNPITWANNDVIGLHFNYEID